MSTEKTIERAKCPKCESADDFETVEELIGHAEVTGIYRDAETRPSPDFAGETEILWDTSETVGLRCDACGWEALCADGDPYSLLVWAVDEEIDD
jgi:hypothetical protein